MGTVVFDLDGVVYVGDAAVPGAAETLRTLDDLGWRLVFATNNSTRTEDETADKIERLTGYRPRPSFAVTSGSAAVHYLRGRHESVLAVGAPGLTATIEAAGLETVDDPDRADAVVVGLDRGISYETIDRAASAIRKGAEFVATNTDATFPTPDGLAPGAGAIVAAIGSAAGAEPVSCGKPELPMRELLSSLVVGDEVVMVGDRAETDLAIARHLGWRAVLTLTGVTELASDVPRALEPDDVITSISELPGLLGGSVPKDKA